VDTVPGKREAAVQELERLRATHGLTAFARLSWSHPPEHAFIVSNLARVPLQLFDFGAGPASALEIPLALQPPAPMCVILPRAGGSLRLLVSVPT
jgi:hypothetical protein